MLAHIGIISKEEDGRVRATLLQLVAYLRQRGLHIRLETNSAKTFSDLNLPVLPLEEIGQECELAIVIGGDGTLLQAARGLATHDILLLGINLGRLGFLTDLTPGAMCELLGDILAGRMVRDRRFLASAEVFRGDKRVAHSVALNDVVIQKWNSAHMFTYTTRIDGRFVSHQRADGVIISTPTGSTAYALSAGGPILHPELNLFLLISICPHTLSNRPLVVDGDSVIELTVDRDRVVEAQLACDGESCQILQPEDRVVIRKGPSIHLVHPPEHDYYATLRTKLHWGTTN